MSTTQAGAGPVSDGTKTPGQIARDAFYDGRTDLLWDELAPASVDDWERAGAAVAALAPLAVVPDEVRRVMQNAITQARGALHLDAMVDDAGKPYGTTVVAMEALAEAEALLSTPSRRTDTPPAGGGAVEDRVEKITRALLENRGFHYAEDPMEYGQNAYDITNETRADAIVALNAIGFAAAPAAPEPAAGGGREIAVDVLTMNASRGPDYFVRIQCGDREVTPHSFRERYKAEYEAAHLAWIFGLRADEPDVLAYHETSYPDTAETIRARPLSAPSEAQDAGEVWQPISTAPPNLAIQVYVPSLDYYGNQGVYAGMLVDMGTGRRWMTFAWAMGCDMFGENVPTHWRPLPPPPTNRADTGAEGGQ